MKGKTKKRLILLSSFCILVLLAALGGSLYYYMHHEKAQTQGDVVKAHDLTLDEKVNLIVEKMTPAQKIGQMVMIGVHGTKVNKDMLYMLHEYNIGGIILFDRNMETPQQVKELTAQLQKQSDESLPLFIGVDEEGGEVARMRKYLPAPPSEQKIGTHGTPQQAKKYAEQTAQHLRALGINLNFAPVVDVGDGDERSYSKKPAKVVEFAKSAVSGYEAEKFLFCLKHFPGIGRGKKDSHIDASKIMASKQELEATDLLPFREIIATEPNDSFFVLVSHLTYPALDSSDAPASLSAPIVTGILRQQLGYKGIIITDDTEMGALSKHYSFAHIGVAAVKAGADIVLVCHEYPHEIEVYNALLKALENGEISQERVDESVRRIVRAKLMYLAK